MAVATGTALAVGAGALIGGIAGNMKDKTSQETKKDVSEMTAFERSLSQSGAYEGSVQNQYDKFNDLSNAGPGASDVAAGAQSSREYADLLKQYQNGGYMPSGSDISSSNSLAQQLFNPQRTAMNQAFSDQSVQANRQAALMGRDINDPILRAKLAQEQTRQGAMLEANQGAWSTSYAMQQPGMRLGYAADRTNVLQGLASQAMSNRQALLSAGSSLQTGAQNFRLGQAGYTTNGESGGGIKGLMTGALGGAGAGASMASGMGGMGGGQSSAMPMAAPAAQPAYFQQSNPYSAAATPQQFGQPRTFSLGNYGA